MENELMEEQEPELETEPTSAIRKCDHGVYIPRGLESPRNCTGCNPDGVGIIAAMTREPEVQHFDRTLDSSDYMNLPVWERLADAGRLEAM